MNCNPFKAFFLTLILGLISTLWMTNLAIASPRLGVANPPSSQYFLLTQASNLQPAQGEPQLKTGQPEPQPPPPATGQTTDQTTDQKPDTQSSSRNEEPNAAKSEDSKSGGPYDMNAIEEFYKSLYGS